MKASDTSSIRTVIISALACLGAFFICMLLFSWAAAELELSDDAVGVLAGLALCAGCFAGAFTAANIRRRQGLLTGILIGCGIFIAMLAAGMLIMKGFTAGGAVTRGIMLICSAAAGGVAGINTKALFK